MKKFHKIIGLVLPLVFVAFIAGCGGSDSSSATNDTPVSTTPTTPPTPTSPGDDTSSPVPTKEGTLSVLLTDAPAEFLAVYVTIAEVHVHRAGSDDEDEGTEAEGTETEDEESEDDGEWIVVATPNVTYDLLELQNGITELLGEEEIPSGDYTQLRLILGNTADSTEHPYAHYIILADDEEPYELTVPSNTLKQNHNFTLIEGSEMEMIIDFDANKSIHPAGKKWMLKPVLHVKTELE